jgi:PleD family two-component response regulator
VRREPDDLRPHARRERAEIAEGVTSVAVTMSLGVGTVTAGAVAAGALIGAAAEALYSAKRGGRDRVSFTDVLVPGHVAGPGRAPAQERHSLR